MDPDSSLPTAAVAQPAAAAGWVALREAGFDAEIDGRRVGLYTIRNRRGMLVRITNHGARIEQILVPDRAGRLGDVAQGYETIGQVRAGQLYMGAFIGRYANRIAHGRFRLDGVEHRLTINDLSTDPNLPRRNTLHGGLGGSCVRVFDARQLSERAVQMSVVFRDGDDGFPGTLPLRVVYAVDDRNQLSIDYDAVAVDRKTVASFTGHAFLNLSGDLGSAIGDHWLRIRADRVLEVDAALVPTGRMRAVAGTPMDFRRPKPIGRDIGADYDLLRLGNGYDHHYVVADDAGALRLHARVAHPASGRTLEVWSTEPGLQFYSGNFLEGLAPRDVGKGGTVYGFRSAFCLEPSRFPDSPNHPEFPSTVLEPGQWTGGRIVYRFGTGHGRRGRHPSGA